MARERSLLDALLELAVEMGASDLHYGVGEPPIVRIAGELSALRFQVVSASDFERTVGAAVPPEQWKAFKARGDLDWAYEVPGLARFRSNLFLREQGPAAVFRMISNAIPSLQELGLPKQTVRLIEYPHGLVLVTGPTGSGKSTTLAALIDHLNRNRRCHILTIEDPIEYLHRGVLSRITQREIGSSARSFAEALRVALREDPDVILVGELRDLDTISIALQAAETGILVLATLHTNSASRTVDRLINVFPSDEQDAVRTMLAGVLRGILAQQLLPARTGGRVLAVELLFWTVGLPNMIREGKPHLIENLIRTGRRQGMIALDDSLLELVRSGRVEPALALERASDRTRFRSVLASEFGLNL